MERCKLCQPIDSECNGCVFYKIDKLQSENSELKNELQDEIFKHAKLQFAYDMLSDKFLRLEEQIEKMKNKNNCLNSHYLTTSFGCDAICHECNTFPCDRWELK